MATEPIHIPVTTAGVARATTGITGIGNAASNAINPVSSLTRNLAGLAAFAGFAVLSRNAIGFSTAMAEVSTIADDTVFNLQELTQQVRDMSVEFGQAPTEQARALYQVISSGAADGAAAQTILAESSRLAVAGLTSTSVAVNATTSVLNAYGLEAEEASRINDILFTGVRLGKTTVDELSGAIGRALPSAAALNVEFEELVGGLDTLTLSGLSTNEAITGLRAVFNAVLNPSREARDIIDELGVDFRELIGRDFGEFIRVVSSLDQDVLVRIFPNQEAIIPLLSLTQNLPTLENQLNQLRNSAGSVNEAFDDVANTVEFQFNRVISALNTDVEESSVVIQQGLVPALETLADHMGEVVDTTTLFFALWGAARVGAAVRNMNLLAGGLGAIAVGGAAANAALGAGVLGVLLAPFVLTGSSGDETNTARLNLELVAQGFDEISSSAEFTNTQVNTLYNNLNELRLLAESGQGDSTLANLIRSQTGLILDNPGGVGVPTFNVTNPSIVPAPDTAEDIPGAIGVRSRRTFDNIAGPVVFSGNVGAEFPGVFVGAGENVEMLNDELSRLGNVINGNVLGSINEFIRTGEQDIPQFFRNLVADISTAIIASQINPVGDSIGNFLGNALRSGLGGSAQFGGTTTVTRGNSLPLGGAGDNRLLLLRTHLGEDIDARATTNGRSGGGMTIGSLIINAGENNADSFRRSIPQLRSELAAQLSQAQVRNG